MLTERSVGMTEAVEKLVKKSEDPSRWYLQLVRMAKLADYGPVRGTFAFRPYGFEIWERVQRDLDDRFKATGHRNAYFPLLIPESYLKKEAEHVEGFDPELAWVTIGGREELEERLAIRPTSESIICDFYKNWIQSYRDLPILINQWCNVLRWEKVTRAFDITFLDENQERVHPYQTSWGFSTRTIGGLILVHGDDRGLRLPPRIAPTQAVIVPIWRGKNKGEVRREAETLHRELTDSGIRMEVDLDEEHSPGWKFNEHELRGVPVRVELGPRDIENGQAVLVRRDTGEKEFVGREVLPERLQAMMGEIQENMLRQAETFREENTRRATSYEEFEEIIAEKRGFVVAPWDGTRETEQKIKEDTRATIRLLPFEREEGEDLVSGKPGRTAIFARAY